MWPPMELWGLIRAKICQSCCEPGLAINNLQFGCNDCVPGVTFSSVDMNQSVPFGLGAQGSLALLVNIDTFVWAY